MPWDRPEINTFIVQPPLKDRSQIIIYLNQLPRSGRDQERLFGIAEIKTSDLEIKNEVQIFLTQLSTKYQEETIENPGLSFEQTLEWANRILRERFDQKKLPYINLIFGCLKNNILQFTALGSTVAQIFFKEKSSYRNLDLLKTYTPRADGQDLYFSNLISGDLHRNNFVLFSVPTLLDFLTIDRLEKIITQTKPTSVCDHLETILNQIENKLAFGGVLIEWPDVDWQKNLPPPPKILKTTPDSSIKQLLRQEEETAKILTPSLISGIKNFLFKNKENKKVIVAPSPPTVINNDAATLKKITKIYTRLTGWQGQLKIIIQKILVGLGRVIFLIYLFFRNLHKWKFSKEWLIKILLLLKKLPDKLNGYLGSIPLKRLILLSLATLTIIILAGSLIFSHYQKTSQLEKAGYNQLVNDIKNKLDEAESSLIYNNEGQGRAKLKEIATALNSFPRTSDSRSQEFTKLQNSYDSLMQKLQHVQKVIAQIEVDLSAQKNQPQPLLLNLVDKNLFIAATNTISWYNLNNKKITNYFDTHLNAPVSWTIQKDNTILILDNSQKLWQFNPQNNGLEPRDVTWAKSDSQISLITTYNGKLYAFDTKYQQISKHNPATTGFGKGEFWVVPKDAGDLSDVSGLTIDGNVYLARNNGEIWKFEKGHKKEFNVDMIAPPLQSPLKLYTRSGSDLLFILDNDKKRIIVWNKKTNLLITRLTSNDFKNLIDLVPDEKNKKIYLLDDSKIESVKY